MNKRSVAIIDDEHAARTTVKSFISKYAPMLETCGEAGSVAQGLQLVREYSPSLVFLDVQMGDGNGFDFLDQLGKVNFDVVFVTAFDDYALQGFKYNALDYLLKPLHPDEFVRVVEKINQSHPQTSHIKKENIPNRLVVNDIRGFWLVDIDDIICCESVNKFTIIRLKNKEEIVCCKSLKELEDALGVHCFFRVHHSCLVNLAYIKNFIRLENKLVMINDMKIEVSRRKKTEFLQLMNNLFSCNLADNGY